VPPLNPASKSGSGWLVTRKEKFGKGSLAWNLKYRLLELRAI